MSFWIFHHFVSSNSREEDHQVGFSVIRMWLMLLFTLIIYSTVRRLKFDHVCSSMYPGNFALMQKLICAVIITSQSSWI